MSKCDLRTISDLNHDQMMAILKLTAEMKDQPQNFSTALAGKTMAMINEKQSLRTKVTFEAGIQQLGGYSVYLTNQDINLGKREPVKDVARNLTRWVDVIVARVFKQETIEELAQYTDVPVVNALSDIGHPCQAIADIFTIWDLCCKRDSMGDFNLTYIGDGNNVCNSLILVAGLTGIHLSICTPEGFEPNQQVIRIGRESAYKTGATITFQSDPQKAVSSADAIYTDVWTSMGQEDEKAKRLEIFKDYQVNEELVSNAPKQVSIMHCLPAHRGEEITEVVLESENTLVFDQAENRLHAQKAIMKYLIDHSD